MIRYSEQKIDNEDIKHFSNVLKSKFLTSGRVVEKFEKSVKNFTESNYCIAVTNASCALILACKALNLKKNDIVWTTPITFLSTCSAVEHCEGKIEFVDINKDTFLICEKKLEEKLKKTKRNKLPKIVIVVHLSGHPCNLIKFKNLSKKYGFKIIEDASHAVGSTYLKSRIGSCKYSDITVFSFHAIKIITTAEGGMCLTNKKSLAEKIQILRNHGIVRKRFNKQKNYKYWEYDQKLLGFNFRMNELQAVLGTSQLKKLSLFIKQRNMISRYYRNSLKHLPIKIQELNKNSSSSMHLFIIKVQSKIRKKFFLYMKKKGVGLNLHYKPVFLFSYFRTKTMKYYKKNFPNSIDYMNTAISIPMHNNLNIKKIKFIIKKINDFFN